MTIQERHIVPRNAVSPAEHTATAPTSRWMCAPVFLSPRFGLTRPTDRRTPRSTVHPKRSGGMT